MSCSTRWKFFGHEELARVAQLRREGRLDEAEHMLREAEPSAAVLDEFRKIFSERARIAKSRGDWTAVLGHLTDYEELARMHRDHCVAMVNAEPPPHTQRDERLLEDARRRLGL